MADISERKDGSRRTDGGGVAVDMDSMGALAETARPPLLHATLGVRPPEEAAHKEPERTVNGTQSGAAYGPAKRAVT